MAAWIREPRHVGGRTLARSDVQLARSESQVRAYFPTLAASGSQGRPAMTESEKAEVRATVWAEAAGGLRHYGPKEGWREIVKRFEYQQRLEQGKTQNRTIEADPVRSPSAEAVGAGPLRLRSGYPDSFPGNRKTP